MTPSKTTERRNGSQQKAGASKRDPAKSRNAKTAPSKQLERRNGTQQKAGASKRHPARSWR
eukprot:3757917-Karenia_brevis.AAC.1